MTELTRQLKTAAREARAVAAITFFMGLAFGWLALLAYQYALAGACADAGQFSMRGEQYACIPFDQIERLP